LGEGRVGATEVAHPGPGRLSSYISRKKLKPGGFLLASLYRLIRLSVDYIFNRNPLKTFGFLINLKFYSTIGNYTEIFRVFTEKHRELLFSP
jgi:hypothetical protein